MSLDHDHSPAGSGQPAGSIQSAEPTILARMLKLDDQAPIWSANVLAGMWLHQLDAPLTIDLIDHQPMNDQTVQTLTTEAGAPTCFRELLAHPDPSPQLLELAKDFAKANRTASDGGLPPEIATMLYYALIAAGIVRTGKRITDLPEASLRKGLKWALQQGWVDDSTRNLLNDALLAIEGG